MIVNDFIRVYMKQLKKFGGKFKKVEILVLGYKEQN